MAVVPKRGILVGRSHPAAGSERTTRQPCVAASAPAAYHYTTSIALRTPYTGSISTLQSAHLFWPFPRPPMKTLKIAPERRSSSTFDVQRYQSLACISLLMCRYPCGIPICHTTGQLHEGASCRKHYARLHQGGCILRKLRHPPYYLHRGIRRSVVTSPPYALAFLRFLQARLDQCGPHVSL